MLYDSCITSSSRSNSRIENVAFISIFIDRGDLLFHISGHALLNYDTGLYIWILLVTLTGEIVENKTSLLFYIDFSF